MTTARVLTDPQVRLGAGTAALLVTAMAARRNRVGPGEAGYSPWPPFPWWA